MQTTRYHYMDNLRATAMLLGVFFHAALAYVPNMQNFWMSASPENSEVLNYVAWFSHLFRMPLFFLIAGFFACYLVGKRGTGGFLKNRGMRLMLPFVIFLPFTYMAMFMPIGWVLENISNPSPMLGMIAWAQANPELAPPPPPTTMHLWFLLNLFFFCVVYAVMARFGGRLAGIVDRVVNVRTVLFVLPLLMVPALSVVPEPHPAPDQFVPQAWSFGYYGLFFLLGAWYFRNPDFLDRLKPWAPFMLITSTAAYSYLYTQLPGPVSFEEGMALFMAGVELTPTQIGHSLLEAWVSLHMTLFCLVAGKAVLDRASKPVRYIADSSYWIYLMHLPTVIFLQYLMLDTGWNLWVEFLVSSVGTILIGLVTYAAFIRWTPIGWMLNGRRKKDADAAPAAITA